MIKIYLTFKYNCIRYTTSQKIKSQAFKYNTLYIYITYTRRQEGIYTWKEKLILEMHVIYGTQQLCQLQSHFHLHSVVEKSRPG